MEWRGACIHGSGGVAKCRITKGRGEHKDGCAEVGVCLRFLWVLRGAGSACENSARACILSRVIGGMGAHQIIGARWSEPMQGSHGLARGVGFSAEANKSSARGSRNGAEVVQMAAELWVSSVPHRVIRSTNTAVRT